MSLFTTSLTVIVAMEFVQLRWMSSASHYGVKVMSTQHLILGQWHSIYYFVYFLLNARYFESYKNSYVKYHHSFPYLVLVFDPYHTCQIKAKLTLLLTFQMHHLLMKSAGKVSMLWITINMGHATLSSPRNAKRSNFHILVICHWIWVILILQRNLPVRSCEALVCLFYSFHHTNNGITHIKMKNDVNFKAVIT